MELIFFKLVAVYEAVCCRVDIMICDVEGREGCTGREKGGRAKEERERESYVDGWSGSGGELSRQLCFWAVLHLSAAF